MIVSDEAPSPELPPVPDADPLCVCQTPFKEAVRQKFKPAKKGDSFGPSWTHHWFRITLTIPESWRGAERIQLEWDPSCEAMVFDGEGLPLQGITGGFGGDRRVDFILDPKSRDSTYRVGPMCTFPSEYLTDGGSSVLHRDGVQWHVRKWCPRQQRPPRPEPLLHARVCRHRRSPHGSLPTPLGLPHDQRPCPTSPRVLPPRHQVHGSGEHNHEYF